METLNTVCTQFLIVRLTNTRMIAMPFTYGYSMPYFSRQRKQFVQMPAGKVKQD